MSVGSRTTASTGAQFYQRDETRPDSVAKAAFTSAAAIVTTRSWSANRWWSNSRALETRTQWWHLPGGSPQPNEVPFIVPHGRVDGCGETKDGRVVDNA
jgi:hypothetical protein